MVARYPLINSTLQIPMQSQTLKRKMQSKTKVKMKPKRKRPCRNQTFLIKEKYWQIHSILNHKSRKLKPLRNQTSPNNRTPKRQKSRLRSRQKLRKRSRQTNLNHKKQTIQKPISHLPCPTRANFKSK